MNDPFRKYRGFVAVDNVARKPGSECKGHCTFEGGFCTWFNEEGDDFQWSLVCKCNIPKVSYIFTGNSNKFCFLGQRK